MYSPQNLSAAGSGKLSGERGFWYSGRDIMVVVGTRVARRKIGLDFLILSCLCRTLANRLGFFFFGPNGVAQDHGGAHGRLAGLDGSGGQGGAIECHGSRRRHIDSSLA